ncbi:MAG: hypothetical protein ACRDHL_12055 [Candidatus Promineifilaceae bacterium]
MGVATAVLGAITLLFGRQVYWLFVGVAGFILGAIVLADYINDPLLTSVGAVVTAAGGALLAFIMQKLALDAAGFITSGYALSGIIQLFGVPVGELDWLVFLVGGIFGALLIMTMLDNALIVLSALTAATLIVQSVDLYSPLDKLLFIGIILIGIAVQVGLVDREPAYR